MLKPNVISDVAVLTQANIVRSKAITVRWTARLVDASKRGGAGSERAAISV